ncbi:hypothetical protein GCM10010174_62020 [Kutzneria viridogrisea]|uniref:Uncharacterized protein n=1 Tax=Kutzneria viridogrisea TaxID=47990 RepID=A0ABR6BG89_9PSEU|nr:hypothetical protein [Kutzneria viridogrisea]
MVDTMPWRQLLAAARDAQGLSWHAAADLAGINSGTWQANETGYWTVEGRRVEAKGGRPATIARMALVVGVSPDQLREAGRPDAATALEQMLTGRTTGADVTTFHERWLREVYRATGSRGAYLDYVLSVVDDTAP